MSLDVDLVGKVLERAAKKLNELVINANRRADGNLEEFLNQPGLGPSIGILADLFSELRTGSGNFIHSGKLVLCCLLARATIKTCFLK